VQRQLANEAFVINVAAANELLQHMYLVVERRSSGEVADAIICLRKQWRISGTDR
jgi:hypothetical protein